MGMFSATHPSEKIRTGSPAQETDASSVLAAGQDCGLVQPLQQEQLQTILDALLQLGASRIRRCIGSGGFSSVYEVEDLNSDQVYALKVTDPLLTRLFGSALFRGNGSLLHYKDRAVRRERRTAGRCFHAVYHRGHPCQLFCAV